MKKKKIQQLNLSSSDKKITRKEAIKKTGITALTAASLMFLQTNASAQTSPAPKAPGNNWPG